MTDNNTGTKPPQGYPAGLTETRLRLLEMGWSPIRLQSETKIPIDKGWPRMEITPELIREWGPHPRARNPRGYNTGLRCDRGLIGIDIDTGNKRQRAGTRRLVEKNLGATPLARVGNPTRVMLLYRIFEYDNAPWIRKTSLWVDGMEEGVSHRVEVKQTVAGQIAAYGMHGPERPYVWLDAAPHWVKFDEVPVVLYRDVVDTIEACERMFETTGCTRAQGTAGPADQEFVYDLEPDMEFETSEGVMTAEDLQTLLRRTPRQFRHRLRIEVYMDPVRQTEHNRMTGLAGLTQSGQLIITDWSEDRKHMWKSVAKLADTFVEVDLGELAKRLGVRT